jgi:hypothetical protein
MLPFSYTCCINNWTTAAADPIFKISKAQQQIEEAVNQMASQMKAETAHRKRTLQNQSVGLDKMEDLTSENVVKVTQVADVQQHVANNWTRTTARMDPIVYRTGNILFASLFQ